jgi:hypothetical protein
MGWRRKEGSMTPPMPEEKRNLGLHKQKAIADRARQKYDEAPNATDDDKKQKEELGRRYREELNKYNDIEIGLTDPD